MSRTIDQFLSDVNLFYDEYIDHELVMRNVTPFGGPVHNKRRQLARILFNEHEQGLLPAIPPLNMSLDLRLCAHFITVCQFDLRSPNADVREKAAFTLHYIQNKLSRINCVNRQDMDNCQRLILLLRLIFDTNNRQTVPTTSQTADVSIPNSTNHTSTAQSAHVRSPQTHTQQLPQTHTPPHTQIHA